MIPTIASFPDTDSGSTIATSPVGAAVDAAGVMSTAAVTDPSPSDSEAILVEAAASPLLEVSDEVAEEESEIEEATVVGSADDALTISKPDSAETSEAGSIPGGETVMFRSFTRPVSISYLPTRRCSR